MSSKQSRNRQHFVYNRYIISRQLMNRHSSRLGPEQKVCERFIHRQIGGSVTEKAPPSRRSRSKARCYIYVAVGSLLTHGVSLQQNIKLTPL
jgi:hypothetical protein